MPDPDNAPTYEIAGFGDLLDVPPERLPEMARCLAAHAFLLQCFEDWILEEIGGEEAGAIREQIRSQSSVWTDNENYEFSIGLGEDEVISAPYRSIMHALFPSLPLAEAAASVLDILRSECDSERANEAAEQLEAALAEWWQPASNLPDSIFTAVDE